MFFLGARTSGPHAVRARRPRSREKAIVGQAPRTSRGGHPCKPGGAPLFPGGSSLPGRWRVFPRRCRLVFGASPHPFQGGSLGCRAPPGLKKSGAPLIPGRCPGLSSLAHSGPMSVDAPWRLPGTVARAGFPCPFGAQCPWLDAPGAIPGRWPGLASSAPSGRWGPSGRR